MVAAILERSLLEFRVAALAVIKGLAVVCKQNSAEDPSADKRRLTVATNNSSLQLPAAQQSRGFVVVT